jgi:predicted RNA methylase
MAYSAESIQNLKRRLAAYEKDVYATRNLAYQHVEIDGQVIMEGEHKERTVERKAWISALNPQGKTVLDLGCNLGVYALEAARLGAAAATGIDIQPNIIAAAGELRDFLGLSNAHFSAVDLTSESARAAVEPFDIVLAFAVYDHLTGRRKRVPPWELEHNYLDITEWLARLAKSQLIVEFHNRQTPWADYFERLLLEHGFEILERRTTRTERPVFFCRRGPLRHDQLRVAGQVFNRLKSWRKCKRRLYRLEQNGRHFLSKRYGELDSLQGRRPADEFGILKAFADVPEVVQPLCHDERHIVLPYQDARPIQIIDAQPLDAADISSPALQLRIVEAMARVLAAYLARKQELFARFSQAIPDRYREEVRTGRRLLVDLCPSNILITRDGQVRFVDFEPSKPPLAAEICGQMQALCGSALGVKSGFWQKLVG